MKEFELDGTGLSTELLAFLTQMKTMDSEMAEILEKNIDKLKDHHGDDRLKRARASFNAAVKKDLMSLVESNE